MKNKDTKKSRGEDFAEDLVNADYPTLEEFIKWAKNEIREYKRFIKIIESRKEKLNE